MSGPPKVCSPAPPSSATDAPLGTETTLPPSPAQVTTCGQSELWLLLLLSLAEGGGSSYDSRKLRHTLGTPRRGWSTRIEDVFGQERGPTRSGLGNGVWRAGNGAWHTRQGNRGADCGRRLGPWGPWPLKCPHPPPRACGLSVTGQLSWLRHHVRGRAAGLLNPPDPLPTSLGPWVPCASPGGASTASSAGPTGEGVGGLGQLTEPLSGTLQGDLAREEPRGQGTSQEKAPLRFHCHKFNVFKHWQNPSFSLPLGLSLNPGPHSPRTPSVF